jgi:hypothetical protein
MSQPATETPQSPQLGLPFSRLRRGARKVRRKLWPKTRLRRVLLCIVLVLVGGSCQGIRTLSRKAMYMPPKEPVPDTERLQRMSPLASRLDYM